MEQICCCDVLCNQPSWRVPGDCLPCLSCSCTTVRIGTSFLWVGTEKYRDLTHEPSVIHHKSLLTHLFPPASSFPFHPFYYVGLGTPSNWEKKYFTRNKCFGPAPLAGIYSVGFTVQKRDIPQSGCQMFQLERDARPKLTYNHRGASKSQSANAIRGDYFRTV